MQNAWRLVQKRKLSSLTNPLFIEGLPGIGNVGKVAIDFVIDELKAEKVYEITSSSFPHSVFVAEDNLVELPTIEIFRKRTKGRDILLTTQDGIYNGFDVSIGKPLKENLNVTWTLGSENVQPYLTSTFDCVC